jgi:hypothetical protein
VVVGLLASLKVFLVILDEVLAKLLVAGSVSLFMISRQSVCFLLCCCC